MGDEQWKVLERTEMLRHPFLSVDMEKLRLPDGSIIEDWPIVETREYANVVLLNNANEVMVLVGYKHGLGRVSWQMPGGYLEAGEAPLAAMQRELMEETGYASERWQYLGSFVVDANRHVGVGHFFLAHGAQQLALPNHNDLEAFKVEWVALSDAKKALFDGRIGIISYATNLALALAVL